MTALSRENGRFNPVEFDNNSECFGHCRISNESNNLTKTKIIMWKTNNAVFAFTRRHVGY